MRSLRRLAAVILFAALPGLAAAQACPDINGPTITPLSYDASQLAQPQVIPMVAGGDLNLSNCADVPGNGFVVSGPDYELQLTGVAPGSNLTLAVQGTCDTVILANDSTGAWQFNDDGPAGIDPVLTFPAADGVYDIWVGTYDQATCNANFSLQVGAGGAMPTPTPTPTPASTCPDVSLVGAPLNFGAAQLASPQRIDVVAGGEVNLSSCQDLMLGGYVATTPDFELNLTGTAPGQQLTLGVEGDCDVVLLVNDNTGAWQFNDDGMGTNSQLVLPAADGVYDIWAGTFDANLCQAALTVGVSGGGAAPTPGNGKPAPGGATTPTPTPPPANVLPDPGNLASYRDQVGATLSFSVVGTTSGSVWGSGPYTDDSTLAAAAVHAGILANGQSGTVTVQLTGPQASFAGSAMNGVNSSNYGSWGGSYVFLQ